MNSKESETGTSAQPAKGNLFIIAAPSGGGKTSLVSALLSADSRLVLSVSHTTRMPRRGEHDGVQYHFINQLAFNALVDEGAFLEHATVFSNSYGTHAGTLQQQLERGLDVILEIDWQGAAQVREKFPDCCSIFILPPSYEILRQRLSRRAQDSEEVINHRMRNAQGEISHWAEFDFIVVNEDFDSALADLKNIMDCARLGRSHQQDQHALLLAELLGNG